MTTEESAARAVRHATAFLEPTHVTLIEVRGPGAFETLDRLLPCDLFVHDGQARQTVLLDEDGSVLADVTVAKLDGAFLLYVDGLDADDTARLVREAAPDASAIELSDLLEENALLSLHGPFAWELGSLWQGQALLSLPPLALFRTDVGVVLRAGRTGEYGYETLVPRASIRAARERLLTLGTGFDLEQAPLDVIDRCTLEHGGFVARDERCVGLSPVELQLQWRTSSRKPHRGRAGLDRRRLETSKRVAWFTASSVVPPGTSVLEDGTPCGEILACVPAPARPGVAVGLALLDRSVSHPGLTFVAGAEVELRTASPPLIEPLSHRVRIHIDRYATRDKIRFPDAQQT